MTEEFLKISEGEKPEEVQYQKQQPWPWLTPCPVSSILKTWYDDADVQTNFESQKEKQKDSAVHVLMNGNLDAALSLFNRMMN